ncbi:MAG: GAF domain-containing protein [Kofleriaceae bacterium]|nr:GAF domain-containing protein [Kofleriaceae bacterium]
MNKCAQLAKGYEVSLADSPEIDPEIDPELSRVLKEQLDNAIASAEVNMAFLDVRVAGRVFQVGREMDPELLEAVVHSGLGRTQIVVSDVDSDPRVPLSWQGRGVGACASMPLLVDNRVCGAVHVFDKSSRSFDDSQIEALSDIAYIIGKRLERFLGPEMEERRESLMRRAVSPAFAELRNALVPLNLGTSDLRMVASDMQALINEVSESQSEDHLVAGRAYEDLLSLIEEMSRASDRVREVVMVVEGIWGEGGRNIVLKEILDTSAGLALHSTRLVGGVNMPEVPREYSVKARRSVVVAGLSLLLSRAAEIDSSNVMEVTPLNLELEVHTDFFLLHVMGKNMSVEECQKVASEVEMLLLGDLDLSVDTNGNTVVMRLSRVS